MLLAGESRALVSGRGRKDLAWSAIPAPRRRTRLHAKHDASR